MDGYENALLPEGRKASCKQKPVSCIPCQGIIYSLVSFSVTCPSSPCAMQEYERKDNVHMMLSRDIFMG